MNTKYSNNIIIPFNDRMSASFDTHVLAWPSVNEKKESRLIYNVSQDVISEFSVCTCACASN